MRTKQSAALERKKFFGDPVMVVTIGLLLVLLALFILYPLAMLLVDSGGQYLSGGAGICPDESAGPKLDAAKITNHKNENIFELFAFNDIQNRSARRAGGLAVIGGFLFFGNRV